MASKIAATRKILQNRASLKPLASEIEATANKMLFHFFIAAPLRAHRFNDAVNLTYWRGIDSPLFGENSSFFA
jgi:hypothetical protein